MTRTVRALCGQRAFRSGGLRLDAVNRRARQLQAPQDVAKTYSNVPNFELTTHGHRLTAVNVIAAMFPVQFVLISSECKSGALLSRVMIRGTPRIDFAGALTCCLADFSRHARVPPGKGTGTTAPTSRPRRMRPASQIS